MMTLKPPTSDPVISLPATAATLAGFRDWTRSDRFPERGRISFIDQEIVIDMRPERLDTHNKVKTEIIRVLANLNVERDLGNLYSDRTSLVNEEVGLSTEPDATFATWKSFETGKIRAVPSESSDQDSLSWKALRTGWWRLLVRGRSTKIQDNFGRNTIAPESRNTG